VYTSAECTLLMKRSTEDVSAVLQRWCLYTAPAHTASTLEHANSNSRTAGCSVKHTKTMIYVQSIQDYKSALLYCLLTHALLVCSAMVSPRADWSSMYTRLELHKCKVYCNCYCCSSCRVLAIPKPCCSYTAFKYMYFNRSMTCYYSTQKQYLC
jgi:hypothetical protein